MTDAKPHVCTSHECCEFDEFGERIVRPSQLASRAEVAAYCKAHPERIEELAELGPIERAEAVYEALHPLPDDDPRIHYEAHAFVAQSHAPGLCTCGLPQHDALHR